MNAHDLCVSVVTEPFCLKTPSHRSIRDGVAERIKSLQSTYPRFQPQLVIIQAGERPDSSVYVRMKAKAAEEVGIKFRHISLPAEVAVEEVVDTIKKLNDDEQTSGILVQLPLGEHVSADGERHVTEAVNPEKDVDGYVAFMDHVGAIMFIFDADSMHTILDTFHPVHRCLCFRRAHHQRSLSY